MENTIHDTTTPLIILLETSVLLTARGANKQSRFWPDLLVYTLGQPLFCCLYPHVDFPLVQLDLLTLEAEGIKMAT